MLAYLMTSAMLKEMIKQILYGKTSFFNNHDKRDLQLFSNKTVHCPLVQAALIENFSSCCMGSGSHIS
jgi:hypothetical protein